MQSNINTYLKLIETIDKLLCCEEKGEILLNPDRYENAKKNCSGFITLCYFSIMRHPYAYNKLMEKE
jgi:hypothetical protein